MIVIGDVHGCYNTLVALIEQLPKDEEICLVGDMIDRGPRSKQVVNLVMNDERITTVLGNHEKFALIAALHPQETEIWRINGGRETMKSFGSTRLPEDVIEWFASLPLYLNKDGVVVSHSAIGNVWNKVSEDKAIFIDTVLWTRDIEGTGPMPDGLVNVFGHTPMAWPLIEDTAICIDTGCVFTKHEALGTLTAYNTKTEVFLSQKNID